MARVAWTLATLAAVGAFGLSAAAQSTVPGTTTPDEIVAARHAMFTRPYVPSTASDADRDFDFDSVLPQ